MEHASVASFSRFSLHMPDQAAQRAAAEDAWRRVVLPAVAVLLGEISPSN